MKSEVADLDVLRKDLEQRRQDLAAGLRASQAEAQAIIAPSADGHTVDHNHPADTIEGDADYDKFLELGRLQKAELLLVDHAIDRLHAGEFGACDHCGDDIAMARLKALPYARYCIDCQENLDFQAHGDRPSLASPSL